MDLLVRVGASVKKKRIYREDTKVGAAVRKLGGLKEGLPTPYLV